MDQIKSKLLADFKKSNKERKEKLAIKYGFKCADDYRIHLQLGTLSEVAIEVESKKKHKIHNIFILDASGSMSGGKYNNGVLGIQSLVKSIQEDKLTDNTITIIEFTTDTNWQLKPFCYLVEPSIVDFEGRGANGGTPLYITLGEIINKLLKDPNISKEDKVLLNVTTDGEDTEGFGQYRDLPQTLKRIQEENNFTVTFVGTQPDINIIIRNLNIDKSNTLVHDNTAKGMQNSFDKTFQSRVMYSAAVSEGLSVTHDFYKREGKL